MGSNDKFMVQLELPGFAPEDFSLKTKDDVIVLEAVHDSKGGESTSRKYVKELKMPEGVSRDQLASSYSADGILTISAPRLIKAPEGAEVSESMAAASKAYTLTMERLLSSKIHSNLLSKSLHQL